VLPEFFTCEVRPSIVSDVIWGSKVSVTEISHGISIETGFTSLGSVFWESQYVYECMYG
jgi:hypothetical protein